MEPMTVWVFAFQVVALFSIAGALVAYLICKAREGRQVAEPEKSPSIVLVTSADTALGLQLCTHLANKGCRVFAGMKDAENSLPAKLLSGWLRAREYNEEPLPGSIIPMELDITREDVLREALIFIGAHLNADERGISAVINTSGCLFRGRFETQDVPIWEQMLKTNILGSLRVARSFVGFLRHTHGRIMYLGAGKDNGEGLVAFNATRVAVEKCVEDLRTELLPYGVSVINLDTTGISPEVLYKPPMAQSDADNPNAPIQYTAAVLNAHSLAVIERALNDMEPQATYKLVVPDRFNFFAPCRSSLRMIRNSTSVAGTVQRV